MSGGHTVLCGSDGLAIRVLDELVAFGEGVIVVTADSDGALAERVRDSDVAVVIGDFRREQVLRRAGIGEASALALLEQDDVANIGVALAAQEDNPSVHLVVRMFNIELGRTLEGLFEDCRILSAAALAAPAFADAAIHGQTGQRVRVCDRLLEVRELAADDPRVVVALMTRDKSGNEQLFPTSTKRVLALVQRDENETAEVRRARQVASLRARLMARLGGVAHLFDRRLALLLGVLLVIVAISSVVFEHFYDLSWTDAISGTITTVAGGGDIDLRNASAALKFYGAAITVVGALTVAVLFALVTDAIVGVRLARALGEPPLPTGEHMVVCGLGTVGFRIVERFVEHEIACIAVEQAEDCRFISTARALGVPVFVADASLPETLARLRIDRARCLLAVTSDDVANLESALAARALKPDLRIVLRLFDADLAKRVERKFDIHISRSLSDLAAPAFVAALLERHMLGVIGIGRRVLAVTDVTVQPGSRADGSTVGELEDRCECRVLALAGRFRPARGERIEAGAMTVVASRLGLRDLNDETAAESYEPG